MRAWLLLAVILAGCNGGVDGDETVIVEPPATGGEWAACASTSAIPEARPFRSEAIRDAPRKDAGIHRVNATTFVWVWASYDDTLREDRVTRVNEVMVDREPDGSRVVCTRVELVTPREVDPRPDTYDVAVRLTALEPLPDAPLRFVVNWVAGCSGCSELPRGNTTARFAG